MSHRGRTFTTLSLRCLGESSKIVRMKKMCVERIFQSEARRGFVRQKTKLFLHETIAAVAAVLRDPVRALSGNDRLR